MKIKIISLEDLPERECPVTDIMTPIDHEAALRLVSILRSHGAVVRQLDCFSYSARLPNGRTEERLCSHHIISFPAQSKRYEVILNTSSQFHIVFPDGFVLRGVEQRGMVGGDKTVLYMPKE